MSDFLELAFGDNWERPDMVGLHSPHSAQHTALTPRRSALCNAFPEFAPCDAETSGKVLDGSVCQRRTVWCAEALSNQLHYVVLS